MCQRIGCACRVEVRKRGRPAGRRRGSGGGAEIEIRGQPVVITEGGLVERDAIAGGIGAAVEQAEHRPGGTVVGKEGAGSRAKRRSGKGSSAPSEVVGRGSAYRDELVGSKRKADAAADAGAGQVDDIGTCVLYLDELEILVVIRAVSGRRRGMIADLSNAQGRQGGDIKGSGRSAPGIGVEGAGEDSGVVGQGDRA